LTSIDLRSIPLPEDPEAEAQVADAFRRFRLSPSEEVIYARDSWIVELRPGEYWVEAPEEAQKGAIVVTRDPSRASLVAEDDNVIRPETFEVFPRARVVKIRVTVVEVDPGSRAS
jgi:hypothetical protein